MTVHRIFAALVAVGLVCGACEADSANCDKELDDYLDLLALAAYGSGNVQVLPEVEKLIVRAKEARATQDSCGVLAETEQTAIARKLVAFLEGVETKAQVRIADTVIVDKEIDWSKLPGRYAEYDLFKADWYMATIESCNERYPTQKKERDQLLEIFFKRIDNPAMKDKAEESMRSSGNGNMIHVRRMMGVGGEDTREWSQDQCDSFASNNPFDRLYANRKKGE